MISRPFRLSLLIAFAGVLALLGSAGLVHNLPVPTAEAAPPPLPEVANAVHHDISPPLRDQHSAPRTDRPMELPLRRVNPGAASGRPDGALQSTTTVATATTAGLGFAGVGNGDYGFAPNAAPPDTNGAVGATQYVQWVNESFAVFDKATGALVYGPVAGNTVWSGFGGGCQTNNDGDPIVQYDKLANRWILTQFSVSTLPYLQCVAVSTTSDATGTYARYSFNYGNTQFPDYPKLGVWPDAYYISFNIFNNGNSFAGPKACAYDRAKMLLGQAATQVCFQLGTSNGSLLPADLDGTSAPPAGSPNIFVSFATDSLNAWKFHVDFATPANSTFSGPSNIPVAAFSAACSGGGMCIPQSGTTQKLDSLADRLMYRLAYRNFGDHEALVVNHSVTAGSSVGVRWYELRNASGSTMGSATPVVYQQGTYAPDSSYRWMGSIAMDHAGDIAVGYSVSSSAMHPGIRYTGRVPGDPLGTMQGENIVIAGGGSQTAGLSRWGDYSAMTVDPVDDCTFWYTNEYLKSSGAFNWSTWIASFKFPGCGTSGPTVPGAPTAVSAVGGNAQATVSFTPPASDGGTAIISYTATSSPGGLIATGTGSPLTVSGLTNGTPYTFTVTATNSAGTSNPSAPSNAVTPATVPGAPTNVTATAGNAQATVSFSPPASNGGSAISSYTVTSSPVGGTATGSGSPLTVTRLTNGTSYTFTVTATNSAGTGPASAPSSAVTPTPTSVTVPGSPVLTATTANGRGIQLNWSVPPDGGSAITGYNVYRALGTNTSVCPGGPPLTTVGSVTSYKDTTAARGQSYIYCVAAINSQGEGGLSNPDTAKAK